MLADDQQSTTHATNAWCRWSWTQRIVPRPTRTGRLDVPLNSTCDFRHSTRPQSRVPTGRTTLVRPGMHRCDHGRIGRNGHKRGDLPLPNQTLAGRWPGTMRDLVQFLGFVVSVVSAPTGTRWRPCKAADQRRCGGQGRDRTVHLPLFSTKERCSRSSAGVRLCRSAPAADAAGRLRT